MQRNPKAISRSFSKKAYFRKVKDYFRMLEIR
jgi:hypothetical protein